MELILQVISIYSLYAFAFIVSFLILTNVYLLVVKRMLHQFDTRRCQYDQESKSIKQQLKTLRKNLDEIDCSGKTPPEDCKNCEIHELNKKLELVIKKSNKITRDMTVFLILFRVVFWLLKTPMGKVLLYFGNIDLRTGSSNEMEGQS